MTTADDRLQERLRAFSTVLRTGMRRGIEKESLRVRRDATLAETPHPRELGSALTHPHITTDFSEALIELITGVHATEGDCLEELTRIHQFVYRHIDDELLWGASMPCLLPGESAIPIARYGSSNVGRMKTIYRVGLSHRYGKRMQMIAGVHYNWSLAEDAWTLPGLNGPNEAYFALIRNFRRHSWLLMYLFGASPAVCATFLEGRRHGLERLSADTFYLPYATSLRMGRLGYLSEAQDSLLVSYNSLASYAASLHDALTHPYPPYVAIGISESVSSGDRVERYRQLATSLLQIENEFYSPIRPKRVTRSGERPLHALRERGVEYVEVRAMDLDPFAAAGIAADTMRFLDVFLLHCVLTGSPPDTPEEIRAIGRNKQLVAARGREPGLRLMRGDASVELTAWAGEVLAECRPIAAALDAARGGSGYSESLAAAVTALGDRASLPSARVLREMRERHDNSYVRFALARSLEHRDQLLKEPLPADIAARFEQMERESLAEQRRIEAADTLPFETYRQRYLASDKLLA